MRRIKNNEAGNDEEQIDTSTAIGQHKGDRALDDLEAVRRDAQRVKGDDGNRRDKAENLDMDEHALSLAWDEQRLKRKNAALGAPRFIFSVIHAGAKRVNLRCAIAHLGISR